MNSDEVSRMRSYKQKKYAHAKLLYAIENTQFVPLTNDELKLKPRPIPKIKNQTEGLILTLRLYKPPELNILREPAYDVIHNPCFEMLKIIGSILKVDDDVDITKYYQKVECIRLEKLMLTQT